MKFTCYLLYPGLPRFFKLLFQGKMLKQKKGLVILRSRENTEHKAHSFQNMTSYHSFMLQTPNMDQENFKISFYA